MDKKPWVAEINYQYKIFGKYKIIMIDHNFHINTAQDRVTRMYVWAIRSRYSDEPLCFMFTTVENKYKNNNLTKECHIYLLELLNRKVSNDVNWFHEKYKRDALHLIWTSYNYERHSTLGSILLYRGFI